MPRPTTEPEDPSESRDRRARRFAAAGDPLRLAILDELLATDRSFGELASTLGIAGSLLAHHLDRLLDADVIERITSSGDRRRRYFRLLPAGVALTAARSAELPGPMLFICTHNSARSQLAAALWERRVGSRASSAGTEPAEAVHPAAIAAGERFGLDLSAAMPQPLSARDLRVCCTVTVCDRAHESLQREVAVAGVGLHWSIPDPVDDPRDDAFDRTVELIEWRIERVAA